MMSLALSVAPADVEDVLDHLIPIAPNGVYELERDGEAELLLFGAEDELPTAEDVMRRCGGLVNRAALGEAPDSWQGRRHRTHRALIVDERLAVRPEWAPRAPEGLTDLVLADEGSFGSGAHPTTRACLEFVAGSARRGALADLGCGSGVLAIAAALLGWSPVIAVDSDAASIEAARANAVRNGVEIDVRRLDLSTEPPPAASTLVANVPLVVHERIASQLTTPRDLVFASGISEAEVPALVDAYRASRLSTRTCLLEGGWAAVEMTRPA